MKFMKFGKALLMGALSAGVVFGVTSCISSYAVGYLYVTGTVTAESTNNGIISGYSIDHNTGKLTAIHGLPVASGGSNPIRAVLTTSSRFLYVLNQGVTASGGSVCTTADPCNSSNIEEFAVGGNGNLTPQETFYTQGINPMRLAVDTSGGYLLVLDHDAPSATACAQALGSSVTSCGDITVFKIDTTTGRLSLVTNAQVTAGSGSSSALTYFPVPANPIDFVLDAGYVLTLSGTSGTGDVVYPYTYTTSTGQLTLSQNSSQTLGIYAATAIVYAGGNIYVLDNEGTLVSTGATSQILPYTVGTGGALQAQTGGTIADDPTLSNPTYLLVESKGTYLYVANQGNNVQGTNADSGITGYNVYTSPSFNLTLTTPSTFGSGSGPQCIVEDPSDQFIYTANYNDSTITSRVFDPKSGSLNTSTRVANSYSLNGPATWCLVDGRTN
jgi:6-phosphogluconolactonase (cycloisomerase 2 family)